MVIESKTLIEDTCRQFERNFAAGDLAKLVSDYYHPECLVVGEGIGRFEGHELGSANQRRLSRLFLGGARTLQ